MYDENDGFFDHVPPPTAPAGDDGEYLTVDPLPSSAGGIAGPIGLGVRVPMIVVSPFSAGGWVCSDVFDHTSQLQFLASLYNLTVPNVSEWRASTVGNLMSTLPVLDKPDVKVPKLPVVSDNESAKPISNECIGADRRAQPQRRFLPGPDEAEDAEAGRGAPQADADLSR